MPKRSSKPPEDENVAAFEALHQLTDKPLPAKNPYAVALGRLGGLKGGHARAKRLTKAKLRAIGKKGAAARWKKGRH